MRQAALIGYWPAALHAVMLTAAIPLIGRRSPRVSRAGS
jgi:hypothetical protein